jgi:cytochrome d ubiquinol oxidase subunit I
VYRTLARRWSRVLVALFAVGVVTGTVLSFEMGLLWPRFVGTFGSVFGLGFAIEGFSFFVEAIFIGVYVVAVGPADLGAGTDDRSGSGELFT